MVKSAVEFLVKKLVDAPHEVQVTQEQRETKIVVSIQVATADRGKVIGKDGQTIRSIRALLNAIQPDDQEIIVEIA